MSIVLFPFWPLASAWGTFSCYMPGFHSHPLSGSGGVLEEAALLEANDTFPIGSCHCLKQPLEAIRVRWWNLD
jgi:hypothetical protein